MLYERWCDTAEKFRDETALTDHVTRRRWTFGELREAAEREPVAEAAVVYPQGSPPEFIITLLAAWRAGKISYPIEPGQAVPELPGILPPCVHLKLTSGTTGAPRLIAFTAGQLMADAENIVATMGLRRDWPNVGVISLAHSYGFSNLVLPLVLHGVPLICSSPLPEPFRQATAAGGRVTVASVPALWRTWHEAGAITPDIRLAISAGAPLPVPLEQAVFNATGVKLHNFYGSSECGGIAYDADELPRTDDSFAGTPLQTVALSINAAGRLVVGSRAVGFDCRDAAPNPDGEYFVTSDLVELDWARVHLRGRAGDVMNIAGRKLSPMIVETVLLRHASVRECVVFGVPSGDANRVDEIAACAVAKSGTTPDELRQFLAGQLDAWQLPRHWRFVETLDAGPRGKVSRAGWRAKFLEER